MRTLPATRTRYHIVPGSMIPLPPAGALPGNVYSSEQNLGSPANENQPIMGVDAPIYAHFPGDIFLPGAQSWVYEPRTERVPVQTTWGKAFLVGFADYFKVYQPPQVYASPNVVQNGFGGLFAGQISLQPLLYNSDINEIEQGTTYSLAGTSSTTGVNESGT